MTYAQARKDHEYLWKTYGAAEDMTGGYVDQDDLDRLLKSPSKVTARHCYENQIHYWFQVGPDRIGGTASRDWRGDPKVHEIIRRHNVTHIKPVPTKDHWGRPLKATQGA